MFRPAPVIDKAAVVQDMTDKPEAHAGAWLCKHVAELQMPIDLHLGQAVILFWTQD